MMNTMILLMSLSILVVLGATTPFTFDFDAFAQINQGHGHFHSLKEMLQDREVGDPLTCPNPTHVLVLRPNSNWACVYFETAKHLNWDMVLYSEAGFPQITKSVFHNGDSYDITYKTAEGIVSSIEYNTDPYYGLVVELTTTQEGDFEITFPIGTSSSLLENFCEEIDAIPHSEDFIYLVDGEEVASEETNTTPNSTSVKLHYGPNAKVIEILVTCLV